MLVDLVQAEAADGLRLDGALHLPGPSGPEAIGVDAWLALHGTGSNFYGSSLLAALAQRLTAAGAAVLRANTRGHDLVYQAATKSGRRLLGTAFERVDEASLDIAPWLALLAARGYRRIGLLGHSLGAVKGIFTLAQPQPPGIAALVAVSPPRLSHARFLASPRGAEFQKTFAAAEAHVAAGRPQALLEVTIPLPYIVSAAGYVDRYGPDERYNVLRHVGPLPCPTLITYGTRELTADVAFAGMPEDLESWATADRRRHVAVIADADHNYTAVQGALADRIEAWLRKVFV